ncbi:FYVE-domain-containing protein [Durotheca rogersii]|uniref:FYVE-domain-containing protein n=1 Tax=Durotheca rogersii TaxID=419775 RepID=UPI00221F7909|nr:FYVE-domain-containing protein [Durotheca rogersii]KAI5864471.1 FYVE-domain-containing protein [Durotheca rogersii]
MATDLIMPRLHEQPQPHFYPYHHPPGARSSHSPTYPSQGYQSQQISPLSTSNATSPTSPKPYHRQRQRPLYMPAVLRPTEHPPKKMPDRKAEAEEEGVMVSSCNSFMTLGGLATLSRLGRRTANSRKYVDGEWNLDMFPKPTAQPTRLHWKPDTAAPICDEPSCLRQFNYWTRRHHCRRCGNIFCDSHSAFDVPLDQDANYNPRGTPSRACSHCFSDFKAWHSRTNSQASSEDSSSSPSSSAASTVGSSGETPASPAISTPAATAVATSHRQDVAMSVPRDWNWSTF